jgi:hypothetical protein
MKTIYLAIFLIITSEVFSLEYFGEIEGTQRFKKYDESNGSLELIVGVEYEEDNLYSQIAIKARDDSEDTLDLYRGYVEFYRDEWTISAGRQMLVWGSAYIFNGADVFNEVDIENPRSDKDGLDSLRIKYNLLDMSRLETVIFKNDASDDNIGARYTFLAGNYEFMGNYFDYDRENSQGEKVRNEDIVLEVKGDAGIGVWSQLIHKKIDGSNQNLVVAGGDYSFDVAGNLLYTLVEGIYIKEENAGALYLMYNYIVSEDIEVFQNFILGEELKSFYLRSGLKYKLNDYFNLEVSYNYYKNFEELKGYKSLEGYDFDSELVFQINGFF